MAYVFGDGFDLYATLNDAVAGYWDSGTFTNTALVAGRFAGSQAFQFSTGVTGVHFAKSSGVNDAVHHIVCAYRQTNALTGATLSVYFQLVDAATNQVCIVFRSDGAILLTSATPAGTVLDTYTGAVSAQNTWFAFEIEVVINNTTGSWAVRKNGNTINDHALGSLNTRPGANNYANKLQIGTNNAAVNFQQIDDLLWRSDASSVPWVGDIRCYTRMPASDQSVQFSHVPGTGTQTPFTSAGFINIVAGTARYSPFTAAYDGAIGTATISLNTGYTGNMKCTIFASSGSAPTSVLGSANVVTNPTTGANAVIFGTPVAVVKGTQYWIGVDADVSSGQWTGGSPGTVGCTSATSYASFPVASPVNTSGQTPVYCTLTITTSTNYQMTAEAQQDAATSYVYDSTPGDQDFYGIAAIASTPVSTIAVTTRGYMEKSDAGTRTAAVQLKSGSATVASPTLVLASSWLWNWRTDLTDPNTSAAWTAAAVNGVNIGPKTIA